MWLGLLISDVALYGRLCANGVPQDAGTFLCTLLLIPVALIWTVAYGFVRRACGKGKK